jgi:ribosome recycling factor
MKITKNQLKQIIKEELLKEAESEQELVSVVKKHALDDIKDKQALGTWIHDEVLVRLAKIERLLNQDGVQIDNEIVMANQDLLEPKAEQYGTAIKAWLKKQNAAGIEA